MLGRRIAALSLLVFSVGCSGGGGGAGGIGGGDAGVDVAVTIEGPATAAAGSTITVRYTFRNAGSNPTSWLADLKFGHESSSFSSLAVVDKLFSMGVLQPGQTVAGESPVELPAGLAGGTYVVALGVQAPGDGNAANDLAMARVAIPGPACTDDAFEDDDAGSDATPLALGATADHTFCFDASDWSRFDARAGEQFGFKLVAEGASVGLFVFPGLDQNTSAYVASTWTDDPGVPVGMRFTAPADGTYGARAVPAGFVYGPGRGYSLTRLPPRPDPKAVALYVDHFYLTPVGGVASVRVDAINDGFAMTAPIDVEFVLSADDRLDPSDRRLYRDTFPAMGEDEWKYVDPYLVPIPTDVAPGEWRVFAVLDPDDALPELAEDNNTTPSDTITLVADACTADAFEGDDTPADAKPIPLGVVQSRNFCDDAYDWTRLDAAAGDAFTIEANPAFGPSETSVRVIAPSGAEEAAATDSWDVVLSFTAKETGTYRIETSTHPAYVGANSEYTLAVTKAQPDLTASALTFSAPIVPGGVVSVQVMPSNDGSATPAGPFDVGVWLSRDGVVDGADVFLGSVTVPGCAGASSCAYETLAATVPPTVATGAWVLLAMADPQHVVPELDETNNAGAPWDVSVTAAACAADGFEDDDFPAGAHPLDLGVSQLRNHCDDRRDWASLTVANGDPLAVRVDQVNGAGTGLRLYAADGTTLLGSGSDAIFWRSDRSGSVLVCAGCDDAPGSFAPASYRLTAALCPPDGNEPDDARTAAKALAVPGTSPTLNGCDGTDDWLTFQANAGSFYKLAVSAAGTAPAPSAQLVDSSGYPLALTRQGEYAASVSGPVWIQVRPPITKSLIGTDYTVGVSVR